MNFLHDIFLETFASRYYFSNSGRAYVEYMGAPNEKFTGKICFFHFSHSNINLNAYHNFEILKFVKLFYGGAYEILLPLMKYAIEKKFVMSMNSLDEYHFIIKFWNDDEKIRTLFENCVRENTGRKFLIDDDRDIRFFEMKIYVKSDFQIEEVIVYAEKDLKNSIKYIDTYIEKPNVFMTLRMKKYNMNDEGKNISTGILIKLTSPIRFSDSQYIMEYIYPTMQLPFSPEDAYVGFIEQGFSDDNLYFTQGYSIPA